MQMFAYILLVRIMRIYKITEISKFFPALLFAITLCFCILTFPKDASQGVKNAIIFCTNVLIPSLFPFMVISAFTVNSGLCTLLEKPLEKITRLLFNLPGCCGTTIFLSMIGGFPIGARGISSLYKDELINEKQAQQMAFFCVSSGPGFLITFVGSSLYGSVHIGLILLIASILSLIILGIISGLFSKKENNLTMDSNLQKKKIENATKKIFKKKPDDFTTSLTKSAIDGTKGIVEMCSMVILFSVIISFGEVFINDDFINNCFLILMEVTTACNNLFKKISLPILAFAIGFGGLCVHFQVFQALGKIKINKAVFFLYRILQGILMVAFTNIGLHFFPVTEQVFSNTQNTTAVMSSSTYLGSIMLILTAVCFLYSLNSKDKKLGG